MRNTADVTSDQPIAVLLQSISGVSAINPLVAFYDIYGGKREVLFFYFVQDTTRDFENIALNIAKYNAFLSLVRPVSYTKVWLLKLSQKFSILLFVKWLCRDLP
jgi:hypothetical protein